MDSDAAQAQRINQQEVQLMWQAKTNPAAFAPLYERYVDRIYAFCHSRTNHPQEAEDLCSQVFSRALGALHTYDGGMVSAWLFRIAHNLIIDHYRARRKISSLDGIDLPTDDDLLEGIEQHELQDMLRLLLDELPDDKRTLLALSLNRELTSEDVGEIVGKSAGAVRVEVHRIINGLRSRYHELTTEEG